MNMRHNRNYKDEEAMSYDDLEDDESREDDFKFSNYEDNNRDLKPDTTPKTTYNYEPRRLPASMFDPNR